MADGFKYRPDIDGLRAVAIAAVVAGHVGLPGFAGGFVGVDIFFVISGFLITSILLREVETTGALDLGDFYARRMRRIVPALCLMLGVVLAAGAVLLPPTGEQQRLADSALSAAGFVSNLYFMQARAGYFAEPAQFMPLLHTWSLGVEEQFYLVWPILLLGCAGLARRTGVPLARLLKLLLICGGLLSLIACVLVMDRAEGVAFYFSPLRAWELAAGALLALSPRTNINTPRRQGLLGVLGLVLIATPVVFYTVDWMFVGAAVPAVAGAACLIMSGAGAGVGGGASRLLASRPLVAVGRVSYAWYLWHWPLLALARAQDLAASNLARDSAIALAALGLAAISWRVIEQPTLQGRAPFFRGPARSIISGLGLLSVCACLAGALHLWADREASSRPIYGAVRQALEHPIRFPSACDRVQLDIATAASPDQCMMGRADAAAVIMLWGDSHARHLAPGLGDTARSLDLALMPNFKSGCRAFIREPRLAIWTPARRLERCARFNRAVMQQLHRLKGRGLRGVILASRWSRDDGWPNDLEATLRRLTQMGLRVLVVADPPAYERNVPQCVARRGVDGCRITRQAAERDGSGEVSRLQRIVERVPGAALWNPVGVMCPKDQCEIMIDGEILYSDAHHLSPAGSRYIGAAAAPALAWLSGASDLAPH